MSQSTRATLISSPVPDKSNRVSGLRGVITLVNYTMLKGWERSKPECFQTLELYDPVTLYPTPSGIEHTAGQDQKGKRKAVRR